MNKTDIIFWGNMLVIDFTFFLTLFSPTLKTNDTFMSFCLILFVPLVFISTVKFLYKPMARDIGEKYKVRQILKSNLSNDEKIKLMELEMKKDG